MANRVQTEKYGNRKEILKFNDFLAKAVTVTDVGVSAVGGKKIVEAGTIVGGKNNPVLTHPEEVVETKNTDLKIKDAEGVLLYDVDVTNGPREGALILEGYIDLDKIEKPNANVNLPKITFLR